MTEIVRLADHRARSTVTLAGAQPPKTGFAASGSPPPCGLRGEERTVQWTGRPTEGMGEGSAPFDRPAEMVTLRGQMRRTGFLLAALLLAKMTAVVLWIAPSIVLPADAAQWQTATLAWLDEHTGLRIALLVATGLTFYCALIFAAISIWPALPRPRTDIRDTASEGGLPSGAGASSPSESRRSRRQSRGARPCS